MAETLLHFGHHIPSRKNILRPRLSLSSIHTGTFTDKNNLMHLIYRRDMIPILSQIRSSARSSQPLALDHNTNHPALNYDYTASGCKPEDLPFYLRSRPHLYRSCRDGITTFNLKHAVDDHLTMAQFGACLPRQGSV